MRVLRMHSSKRQIGKFLLISFVAIIYLLRKIRNENKDKFIQTSVKLKILKKAVENLVHNKTLIEGENNMRADKGKEHFNICAVYDADAKLKRFYAASVWNDQLQIIPDDVTFVTQLSLNRIHLIDMIIKQWSGPLSVALCLGTKDLLSVEQEIVKYPAILERSNIDFHMVLASGVSSFFCVVIRSFA